MVLQVSSDRNPSARLPVAKPINTSGCSHIHDFMAFFFIGNLFIYSTFELIFCDSDQHKHLNQFVRIDNRSFLVILQPLSAVPAGQTIECRFFFFILGTSGDQNEKGTKK